MTIDNVSVLIGAGVALAGVVIGYLCGKERRGW